MRALFAALIAAALALLQGWASPACACEEEPEVAEIVAACCCGDLGGACPAPCVDVPLAATPGELLLPAPALDVLAPPPTLSLAAPWSPAPTWRPALARGPPGETAPIWLRSCSLRR